MSKVERYERVKLTPIEQKQAVKSARKNNFANIFSDDGQERDIAKFSHQHERDCTKDGNTGGSKKNLLNVNFYRKF